MREIHGHETNAVNKQILIVADDVDFKNGNASHKYLMMHGMADDGKPLVESGVNFQHGPIGTVGVNGVTNEALLVIVADRLSCFQTSKYACEENATALQHVSAALSALEQRTKARESRGVEGTHDV